MPAPHISRRSLIVALFACAAAQPAAAGTYPTQNITFVVSFAPGGIADVVARIVAQKVAERAGWTIIIENRGGAGGDVAARMVSHANPDGYTVLATTTALAINAAASRNKGFAVADLTPVAVVASSPDVLAVHPKSSATTLAEFIAERRGKTISFGSAGVGTTTHVATEYLLRELAKVSVTHVPFNGGMPAVNAALGNHVDLVSASLPTAFSQINEGTLRGIGVAGAKRSPAAPGVPTYGESGYSLQSANWIGFFVPAQTPDPIIARLSAEINEAVKSDDVQKKLEAIGFETIVQTRTAALEYINDELTRWQTMTRAIGFVMN